MAYNMEHGIVPTPIRKERKMTDLINANTEMHAETRAYVEPEHTSMVADPVTEYLTPDQLEKAIARLRKHMQEAAKRLDFNEAAQYRDEMLRLEAQLKAHKGTAPTAAT